MNSQMFKIVLYQHVGFLIVILLCFLDELLKLPALVFSDHPFAFVFRRPTLEMLLVLAVWLLVSNSTNRLLKRVNHLASFMRVCAWCHRIHLKDNWVPMEDFMRHGFATRTTHGICPDCLHQQEAVIHKIKAASLAPSQSQSLSPT